jgi:hypothetical protein
MVNKEVKDKTLINAYPTKELFISRLIKDVTLKDAIGDLLDNSVDGALRIRKDHNYEGLWVHIELNTQENFFEISDNCGGIPVSLARDYVFCFGRPEGADETSHSIGAFGIGMKRALFRLGNKFKVESIAQNSSFTMEVDVDKWRRGIDESGDQIDETKTRGDWTFRFTDYEEDRAEEYPEEKRGTIVTVTNLHHEILKSFRLENDTTDLIEELQREHLFSINNGLEITVNGVHLDAPELKLLESDELKTAYWEHLNEKLEVRVYAGISEETEYGVNGGWYVFCNKRLILGPDQSKITGWGIQTPIRIPEYHPQFYRFRGYVFLDAENPRDLPWNSSKTNMDLDSLVWRTVFQQMVRLMRSVIDFLNKVHNEERHIREEKIHETPLQDAMNSSEFILLSQIVQEEAKEEKLREVNKFVAPEPAKQQKQPTPEKSWIRYPITKTEEKLVKEYFDELDRLGDIGRSIFDYFFEREIEG